MKKIYLKKVGFATLAFLIVLFSVGVAISSASETGDQGGESIVVKILDQSLITKGTALETAVYPGYTMTFKVAVTSFRGSENDGNNNSVEFTYTVVDLNNKELMMMTESRDVHEGEVFSKSITLPQTLKEGQYKLRINAISRGSSYTEERYFSVKESPVDQFGSLLSSFLKSPIFLGVVTVIILIIFLIVRRIRKR